LLLRNSLGDSMNPPPADNGHGSGSAACGNAGNGYSSAIVVSNEKKTDLSNLTPAFPRETANFDLPLMALPVSPTDCLGIE
jgi:hypothetical protein